MSKRYELINGFKMLLFVAAGGGVLCWIFYVVPFGERRWAGILFAGNALTALKELKLGAKEECVLEREDEFCAFKSGSSSFLPLSLTSRIFEGWALGAISV